MKKIILSCCFAFMALHCMSQTFQWVRPMIWGYQFMDPNPIAVDSNGNVYTAGSFYGSKDFDPGPDTFLLSTGGSGSPETYVQKLDSNGNFVWAGRMGGYSTHDEAKAITVDNEGNMISAGRFSGVFGFADFDPGPDTCGLQCPGDNYAIYISKLGPSGNCIFAGVIDPVQEAWPLSLTTDASNNIYMCGQFKGSGDFDPGPGVSYLYNTGSQTNDAFVVKLDPLGNAHWVCRLGGLGNDVANEVAVDAAGNTYVTGYFTRTADFDPGAGTFNITAVDDSDIFIVKLDTAGQLVWAAAMGGEQYDIGYSIDVDDDGNVYATGSFQKTVDFDPGPDSMNITTTTGGVYLQKLNTAGQLLWVKTPGGAAMGRSVRLDGDGEMILCGTFSDTADFNTGPGTDILTPAGSSDIFFMKLDTSGNHIWAESIGGTWYESMTIAAVNKNEIFLAGSYFGTLDFDAGPGVTEMTGFLTPDYFVMKYNSELVGISSIPGTVTFSLYPNPAAQSFTVRLPESQNAVIDVYNMLGEKVLPSRYITNGQFQVEIEIDELPPSVYLVNVVTEEGSGVGRLVVGE